MKMLLKVLASGTIGVLTMFGGLMAESVIKWPVPMSNNAIIAWLIAPIPLGLLVAVLVYRILDAVFGRDTI